ncbi:ATP phosphoribosyltransferase [bacterium BMS3Abin02]|nr:ATP phosphoribosyltransferase [bacterium BMS3Abin02]GBE23238.1 ATP phosphoribosyltransferase [bacterium BMS3Bbin01]HDH26630.1 ATP phosphoribosyltransferase [Actinomycetota bacterium]
MTLSKSQDLLHLAVPKGRIEEGVVNLLADAGLQLRSSGRGYRPQLSVPGYEVKLLKPQNIVEMLAAGSRDIGFAGADWVAEKNAELVEMLDTGLDPVRLIAAAPLALLEDGRLPKRRLTVASEYERLSRRWIAERGLNATFVHSYGATEVFPPEDADVIVDNTATGETLSANGLAVVDELITSSTRLYASPQVLDSPAKMAAIDGLVLSLQSVLEARRRVMVEFNVSAQYLERIIEILPRMREPTIARLHGDSGMAVKAAVPRSELPALIPLLKEREATDIAVSRLEQIVP